MSELARTEWKAPDMLTIPEPNWWFSGVRGGGELAKL